jgi:FtsH-binding integral membrane protein
MSAMNSTIRFFLFIQAALFAFAALAHFGIIGDRNDPGAGTAESVIGVALLAGLLVSLVNPAATRTSALAAQGFALLGTLVGFTLVLTVGPTTTFDVSMHLSMLVLLVTGLAVTIGAGRATNTNPPVSSRRS